MKGDTVRAQRRRGWFADRLRFLADRIDRPGAFKSTSLRFTMEEGTGIVFRDDGYGCRLWYCGDLDYRLAWSEAGPRRPGSTEWLPWRVTAPPR